MKKEIIQLFSILIISMNASSAIFSDCDDHDYIRPKLEDFYFQKEAELNEEDKEEPKLKTILKKLCLKEPDEFVQSSASFYATKFNGRRTASAEIFDNTLFTAAHRTLGFGSYVLVENPNNGKQVIVRINDRGPFISGRDLDLSYAAADMLEITRQGVANINYKVLDFRD